MLLVNSKPFINLDSYLDISKLLSHETDFYKLYSKNIRLSKSTWSAGSIPFDNTWEYVQQHRTPYYHLHNEQFDFDYTDREELATFLELKFNSFNPYKHLHLLERPNEFREFVNEFPQIVDFFKSLPFDSLDHITLFYNSRYMPQGYHRDYNYFPVEEGEQAQPETVQDLIWFRFRLDRPFYLYELDDKGNVIEEIPVEGHSVFFNEYNWHGNVHSTDRTSLTIKIEGKFKQEFRECLK
jgi:hypothetical protein